jgi:phosphopantetheinyl transferase (holo-ACP synthase)
VGHQSNGSPLPVLSPRLTARLKNIKIHLSLSHSDHYATAVVVLETMD